MELAEERGRAVDVDGYHAEMERHRDVSRAAVEGDVQRAAEFTRGAGFETEFVGYAKTDVLTQIARSSGSTTGTSSRSSANRRSTRRAAARCSDHGWIERDDESGTRAELVEAHRFGDDQALLFRGDGFSEGDRVRAVVPWGVRFPTMANHTATHLLHQALRETLGEHVRQAGSAVRPDKLRFDFTHEHALEAAERERVERIVNGGSSRTSRCTSSRRRSTRRSGSAR